MKRYTITFYLSYNVSAENKNDAIIKAKEKFDADFTGKCFNISKCFKFSVEKNRKDNLIELINSWADEISLPPMKPDLVEIEDLADRIIKENNDK